MIYFLPGSALWAYATFKRGVWHELFINYWSFIMVAALTKRIRFVLFVCLVC